MSVDLSEFFSVENTYKKHLIFRALRAFFDTLFTKNNDFFLPPDDLDPRVLLSILRRVCQSILAKRNRSSLHRENRDTQFDRLNQTSNVYAAV